MQRQSAHKRTRSSDWMTRRLQARPRLRRPLPPPPLPLRHPEGDRGSAGRKKPRRLRRCCSRKRRRTRTPPQSRGRSSPGNQSCLSRTRGRTRSRQARRRRREDLGGRAFVLDRGWDRGARRGGASRGPGENPLERSQVSGRCRVPVEQAAGTNLGEARSRKCDSREV